MTFFPDLVVRGLCRVALVTSDTQPGLGRDWRHSARSGFAAVPNPLRGQPDVDHPEILLAMGAQPTAPHLRPVGR